MTKAARDDCLLSLNRGAEKATKVIEALLLLSRVRSMKVVALGPLEMGTIVQEALSRISNLTDHCAAQIKLPDHWPVALGYGPWIEEIWENYLSNAVKYGGTPPIIELGSDITADGKLRFWVRDNGPGLSPEDQTQLFRPFTRLKQNQQDGQGLGLSIVQRIAERLNGEVGVESQVGRGSLFYFTLPATLQS